LRPPGTERACRNLARLWANSTRISRAYAPCFRRPRRLASRPSAVLGPVLLPPCIRHRPLRIAGDWHGVAFRVRAPQRRAFVKSPGGLPFLREPRRRAWGRSFIFSLRPLRDPLRNGLATTAFPPGPGQTYPLAWADDTMLTFPGEVSGRPGRDRAYFRP